MEVHAIQLRHIGLSKIDFIGYRSGAPSDEASKNRIDVNFSYVPYNSDEKTIMLIGQVTIGKQLEATSHEDIEDNPFYLDLRLHGFFSVDEDNFDIKYIESFANTNAPILMYPYLREHVHSLAIRCGYPNVVLPLVNIPRQQNESEDI